MNDNHTYRQHERLRAHHDLSENDPEPIAPPAWLGYFLAFLLLAVAFGLVATVGGAIYHAGHVTVK